MILILFISLILSMLTGAFLLRYRHLHQSFTLDNQAGPQKTHKKPALRIGGVPILLGWVVGLIILYFKFDNPMVFLILLSVAPVFVAGLIEDVSKKVTPRWRLIFAILSSCIAVYVLDISIVSLGFSTFDEILSSVGFSFFFTVLCLSGVTHSFNIIDGHNGLSGMIAILILMALVYVSYKLNDYFITTLCLSMVGALFGFLFWNFPRGLIFAGDSGAYLMGFVIGVISLVLVSRHAEVSPWFPFLVMLYPVFETVFSMYRRFFLQSRSVSKPDSLHLHSIIYRRLVRWAVGSSYGSFESNSMTSPYLWLISLTTIVPAILFWNRTELLILFSLNYIVFYIWLYRKIVKFRTPKYLMLYRSKNRSDT